MPDDALQVDTGPRLAGPQTGWIPFQCSWDASILGVRAYWPCPHHQLLGVRGRQGRRGEGGSRGQGRSGGPGVTRSRGGWHRKHGVHLTTERESHLWNDAILMQFYFFIWLVGPCLCRTLHQKIFKKEEKVLFINVVLLNWCESIQHLIIWILDSTADGRTF